MSMENARTPRGVAAIDNAIAVADQHDEWLSIDPEPQLSIAPGFGIWVQAWVFIHDEEATDADGTVNGFGPTFTKSECPHCEG